MKDLKSYGGRDSVLKAYYLTNCASELMYEANKALLSEPIEEGLPVGIFDAMRNLQEEVSNLADRLGKEC